MVLVSREELEALKSKVRDYETDQDQIQNFNTDNNNKLSFYLKNFVRSFRNYPTTIKIGRNDHQVLNQSHTYGVYEDLHQPQYPGGVPEPEDPYSNYSATATNMKNEPIKGYMIGINPYQDENETINFHEDAPLLRTRLDTNSVVDDPAANILGPFSWGQLQRKNYWLSIMRQYIKLQKSQTELEAMALSSRSESLSSLNTHSRSHSKEQLSDNQHTPHSINSTGSLHSESRNSENSYSNSHSASLVFDDSNPYMVTPSNNLDTSDHTDSNSLSLSFSDSPADQEARLVEQVRLILPKKIVVWTLVKRFFSHIYPFCPHLDERDCRTNFERVIGPESYENESIAVINVTESHDILNLGLLLAMLRLSYLSLFSNKSSLNRSRINSTDPSPEAQTLKLLLSTPITPAAVVLAHICLHQHQLFKRVHLMTLQLALVLNFYHFTSPEDGDGLETHDGRIYHGTLVQMAYMLRLHREPSKVKNAFAVPNERYNHLRRRIWSGLLTMDFVNSFNTGHPLAINKDYYDTMFPSVIPGNENLYDATLDRTISQFYSYDELLVKGPMKNILQLCLDVNHEVKLSDLTKYLNQMEVGTSVPLGRLIDYIRPLEQRDRNYIVSKTTKAVVTINTRSFYLLLYFYLMSYYEEKGNIALACFYMKKLFSNCIEELVPCFLPFILQGDACFGEGTGITLNQLVLQALYRCNEMILIGIIRANALIYKCIKSSNHRQKVATDPTYKNTFKVMIEFLEVMVKCMKITILASLCLSDRYYFAWAISKSHIFLLGIVTNENFYAEFLVSEQNAVFADPETMEDLTRMGTNSCKYIEKVFLKNSDADLNEIIENNQFFHIDDVAFYQEAHDSMKEMSTLSPNVSLPGIEKFSNTADIDFMNSLDPGIGNIDDYDQLNRSIVDEGFPFDSNFMQTDFDNIPDLTSAGQHITQRNDLMFPNAEVDNSWIQLIVQKTANNQNQVPLKNSNPHTSRRGSLKQSTESNPDDVSYNNQTLFSAINNKDQLGIFNDIPLDQIFQNHFDKKKN